MPPSPELARCRARLPALLAGMLTLLLGACASVPRDESQADADAPDGTLSAPAPVALPAPAVATPPAVEPIAPPQAQATLWERLRAGFEFTSCDADASARRWQSRYTRGPGRFAASMERTLPSLDFVLGQIESRGLPTEFALLPIIESWYMPVRSRGNRPAGIWQIMPATGRHLGLEITAEYDGRLDLAASTLAALELLEHLAGSFHRDWKLVNMAYNAGEFRIRRSLPGHVRNDGSIAYGSLPVSHITHEHLAKLQAVACILRQPGRFEVLLPEFDPARALVATPLDGALDIELAAQLAAMPLADFRSLNPAALGTTLRARQQVLLPASRADAFRSLLARVPIPDRTGWRRRTLATPVAWTTLAHGSGPDAETLAAIHHVPDSGQHALGSVLLRTTAPNPPAAGIVKTVPRSGRYAVLAGDSLWRIARRFGVAVDKLLGWNRLHATDVLVPGQVLWITEPRLE